MAIGTSALFSGIAPSDLERMLPCLNAQEKTCQRGQYLLHAGQTTNALGVVLEGRLRVEVADAWGNVSILQTCEAGEIFAPGYACMPGEALDIDVVADTNAKVVFLEAEKIIHPCPHQCACHITIASNLMRALARRNLEMNRRAMVTTPKTIRGKILAYLSQVQKTAGTQSFEIPYSQTKLAAYLGVDRSTLSAELGRLRKEGVIDYQGTRYKLNS